MQRRTERGGEAEFPLSREPDVAYPRIPRSWLERKADA